MLIVKIFHYELVFIILVIGEVMRSLIVLPKPKCNSKEATLTLLLP